MCHRVCLRVSACVCAGLRGTSPVTADGLVLITTACKMGVGIIIILLNHAHYCIKTLHILWLCFFNCKFTSALCQRINFGIMPLHRVLLECYISAFVLWWAACVSFPEKRCYACASVCVFQLCVHFVLQRVLSPLLSMTQLSRLLPPGSAVKVRRPPTRKRAGRWVEAVGSPLSC